MKISLEILVISLILLISTYAQRIDYFIQPVGSNWTTAWNICELSGLILLPDIGLDGFKKSGIFDQFEIGELVWLNAKDVEIVYTSREQVHLKLAQIPADSKLTAFLCHDATRTKKFVNLSSLSWNEAHNYCRSASGWNLYNMSSSKRTKIAASLLAKDVPFWVGRTVKGRIPNLVSEASNIDEMCLGVMKMADGTLAYRRDNCTERHRFVSVPSVESYALAITKVTTPYPLLNGEIQPDLEAETIRRITNDGEYIIQPESSNWKTAWNKCELSGLFLLPDLGLDRFKKSGIFDDFEVGELVWLNAKDVYTSGVQFHLKLAQIPADSKLPAYLCHHATTTKKYVNVSSLSWNEAYNVCKSSSGWNLYNMSSSKRAKKVVSLLAKDVPFWVARTVKGRIPNFVSKASNIDEMCLGVMKMAGGTLAYRRDNCTESHRFISVPSVDSYALAITKVTTPYPLLNGEIQPDLEAETIRPITNDGDDSHDNATSSENMTGVIEGGTLGGIVVICGAIVAIYFLRRRWRSRRDYLRSLHQYTQRGLLQNTLSRGETLSGPLQNSSSCARDVADEELMSEEYEDCEEKRKYADCQNDVVKDVRSRNDKNPDQVSGRKGLEQLPANKSKTVTIQAVQLAEPASLNDLQAYETVESDSIVKKRDQRTC